MGGVDCWCTICPSPGIGDGVGNIIQAGYTVGLCGDDILRQNNEVGAKVEPRDEISIEIRGNKQHGKIDGTNRKCIGIYSTSFHGITTIKNRLNWI